jgi:hypothetical protein
VATEVISGQPQQLAYVGQTTSYSIPSRNGHQGPTTVTVGACTALLANANTTTATPVWQSQTLNPIGFSSPAVANGVVFCADLGNPITNTNGKIYAFDARGISDGNGVDCQLPNGPPCSPLWSSDLGYNGYLNLDLIGSPAVAGGMVFETAGSQLYAFCVSGVDC